MLRATTEKKRRANPLGSMKQPGSRLTSLPALGLLLLCMIYGCDGNVSRDLEEKVLIRAGGSVVTVRAFQEAFESSITAPSRLYRDPDALRNQKYRVLDRLSEEIVILERARELNLRVSDEETTRVINDIKKDYPDDTFEKTLMENGISFRTWEKALKRRLLMEKVIRRDLSEEAFRTPLTMAEAPMTDDLESPPEEEALPMDDAAHEAPGNDEAPSVASTEVMDWDDGPGEAAEENPEGSDAPETDPFPNDKKTYSEPPQVSAAEAGYPGWINRLKQQYAIEIDWKLWEIIEQEQEDDI